MNRRQFLHTATATTLLSVGAKGENAKVTWKIGCFNRPWDRWSFDEALDGMKAAGFTTIGLLGDHKGEPFIYPEATPETLETLRKRIQDRGLKVILGRMHARFNTSPTETLDNIKRQIDNAHTLKLKYVMAIGPDKPEEFDAYYAAMHSAATYAKPLGLQIVFKPHGGIAASAESILKCLQRVNHPNFRLWYDAGNIIHYTDKDPVTDSAEIARLATGFCAKDCAKFHGDVMIPFGAGKVDFSGVFHNLKAGGFKGPVMIECCGGQTPAEVTAQALGNRLFLERIFANLT